MESDRHKCTDGFACCYSGTDDAWRIGSGDEGSWVIRFCPWCGLELGVPVRGDDLTEEEERAVDRPRQVAQSHEGVAARLVNPVLRALDRLAKMPVLVSTGTCKAIEAAERERCIKELHGEHDRCEGANKNTDGYVSGLWGAAEHLEEKAGICVTPRTRKAPVEPQALSMETTRASGFLTIDCPVCHGSGAIGRSDIMCDECQGKGRVSASSETKDGKTTITLANGSTIECPPDDTGEVLKATEPADSVVVYRDSKGNELMLESGERQVVDVSPPAGTVLHIRNVGPGKVVITLPPATEQIGGK